MEIFYTGESERRLLTIFNISACATPRETTIVICNPLGHEYIRYYKTLSVLAKKLAAEGFGTVRFDYFGTGDSYGDDADLTPDSARRDVENIIREVKEATGSNRICLVGVRFGTLVSSWLLSATEISGVVLWNPVYSVGDYIAELKKQQKQHLSGSFAKTKPSGAFEALGFIYNPCFLNSDEAKLSVNPALPTFVLADEALLNQADWLSSNRYKLLTTDINDENQFWVKDKADREKTMVPATDLEKIFFWIKNTQL